MCAPQSPIHRPPLPSAAGSRSRRAPPERHMSVINKMLRDLDRRHALPDSASGHPNVRVVPPAGRSDAFWVTLGAAALVAVGWLSWVVYQLQPKPLATPAAPSRPAAGAGAARN